MGLKRFERVYYSLFYEYDDCDGEDDYFMTIQPRMRICYDSKAKSLVIRKTSTFCSAVDPGESAIENYLASFSGWRTAQPITVEQAISEIVDANEDSLPLSLDMVDRIDPDEGDYYDGTTAKTFRSNEQITRNDIKLIAYETTDYDSWNRPQPDAEYWCVKRNTETRRGEIAGICAYKSDGDTLYDHCEEAIGCDGIGATRDYMLPEDLDALTYAVLAQQDWTNGELFLIAALATKEQAELIAAQHDGAVIKKIRK